MTSTRPIAPTTLDDQSSSAASPDALPSAPLRLVEGLDDVTAHVVAAMSGGADGRLREIAVSFVRHLHEFAREVRLTEGELEQGIAYLNRIGQATTDTHNEGILFSDAIGLSTLVCLMNNGLNGAAESTAALLGPFWRLNSPRMESGASIVRSDTPGPVLFADCLVRDRLGQALSDVAVDVWQASPVGLYENQDTQQADMNLRGTFVTDAEGRFSFRSVKPAGYPVPTHGPVGDMLRVQNRHPFRPAHLHFLAVKPGFKTLITQVFVDDDEHLQSDVVFGVTRALVGGFTQGQGLAPDGQSYKAWWRLTHTLVMEPGASQLPHPPIR